MFKRKPKAPTAPAIAETIVRFGVKAKLQLAFGAVAVMTVIAASVAIMSFSSTEEGFQRVAGHEVPVMTDALRLSVSSGEISAAAARFVSAKTADEQKAIAATIAARSIELNAIMERLRKSRGSSPAFVGVEASARRLDTNLQALKAAISDRMMLRAKLEAKIDAVHKTHSQIADKLTPIVDDSYFEVVSTAESVGKSSDRAIKSLIDHGLQRLQAIVEIGGETNLLTGLLTASALTSSQPILVLLEDRFTASAQRAQKFLKKLPEDAEFKPLRTQIETLLKLAEFKPAQRSGEMSESDRLKRVFRAHESLTGLLIKLVDDLNFDLVINSESTVKKSGQMIKALVNAQISGLRNALEIAAQTHLISSLISEGASARDSASLVPIQDRYRTAATLVIKVAGSLEDAGLRKSVTDLVAYGAGSDNAFSLRGAELQADGVADKAIKENQEIQRALDQAVSTLVNDAETSMNQGATRLMDELGRNRALLLLVAVLSLVAAGAIGVFYVQRRLVARLTAIGAAMKSLSEGHTDLTVPATGDKDEIGAMARALVVFRDAAVEKSRFEREAAENERRAAAAKSEQERLAIEQKAEHERVAAADRDAAMARLTEEFEAAVGGIVSAALSGDFSQRVPLDDKQGFILNLGTALNSMCENVETVLDELVRMLGALSEGNLTHRIDAQYQGTFATLKDAANTTATRLAATVHAVKSAAEEVASAAGEISSSTTDLSQRTEEQAASIEQTSASMEQISNTVHKNAENAQEANRFTSTTREVAERGRAVVADAVKAMSRIEESSRKISDIIGVIDEIARQTNLLALNAAVEAARAGDAGRGFAVVASEVRSLAQRSSQAAKDIKDLIGNSTTLVKDGVGLVNRTGESLQEMVKSIQTVAGFVGDIAHASAEQATGLDHVGRALGQMDQTTQQNSALVEENAATAKTLEIQAAALKQQVSLFRLGDAPGTPKAATAPPASRPAAARGPAGRIQGALAMALADEEF
jgi:methyl-accepting chemotaxis protein